LAALIGCVPAEEQSGEAPTEEAALELRTTRTRTDARPSPDATDPAWGEAPGPLWAREMVVERNGFEGQICIGSAGCTGPSGDIKFDLPAGVHDIYQPSSLDYPAGSSTSLGTITVDQTGAATLQTTRLLRVGPHTLRARTVEIEIDQCNYPGLIGFDGSGRPLAGSKTRLLVGRRYMLFDYESLNMTMDSHGGGHDLVIDPQGVVSLGPALAASFTLKGRTLVARTRELTIDQGAYKGVFAIGSLWKTGSPVTFTLLENRRYYISDYRSMDGARGGHPFSATWDLSVDGTGRLRVEGETRRFFKISAERRRLEPIVGTVVVKGTGPTKFCLSGQPIACACPGETLVAPMILGRDFRIHRSLPWVKFSDTGVCSTGTINHPDGDQLTIACSASAPRSCDVNNDDAYDGWIYGDQPGDERYDPRACRDSCPDDHRARRRHH
jgi:hypothetical protein